MVFGNLSTGYWLGAAAVGDPHWQELGRTTLSSGSTTIDVTSLAAKPYLMILGHGINSANANTVINCNNDSGSNYIDRRSENGGADTTTTARTNTIMHDLQTKEIFNISYINNVSNKEKLMIHHVVGGNESGAGTSPDRIETVGKWANTSASISSWKHTYSQNVSSGSEVVVLGYDPADTTGSSVWEELASVTGDGTSKILDSGTITAKKYLFVEVYGNVATQMDNMGWRFNSDTGSNYARRLAHNGAEATSVNQTFIRLGGGSPAGNDIYVSCFIINKSDKEKLSITETNRNRSTGAGNAPDRFETVGKWTNTSSQITSVQFRHDGSSNWSSDSSIKVWGFD